MKKSVLFLFIIAGILFLSLSVISADLNSTQINNGFACLSNLTTSCSSLSIGEQIFTSLATGQCTSSVSSSSSNGCYPSGSCNVKTTAQAILALHTSGISTANSVSWLLSQQHPTSDLNWFMQVNANSNTSCTISYSGLSYTAGINPDNTLSNGAGNCLTVSQNGYWLAVAPSCYNTTFSISCSQQFTTTNLYQRQGYPTIYVSGVSNSASSGGKVTDTVGSYCFGTSGCDYEGSLWSSLVLDSLGYDVSSYLPYLTTHAADSSNQKYLPYSFLYALTSSGSDLQTLLSQQTTVNGQSYWQVSGDPYYDTALGLLPLQSQTSAQQASAENWLLNSSGADGCWNNNNVLDTAFILYSLAGSRAQPIAATSDCIGAGYYCASGISCNQAGGSILSQYICSGTNICCSKQLPLQTCSQQGGIICSSSQTCGANGQTVSASDTSNSQRCCVGGACTSQSIGQSNCELAGGTCQSSPCSGNEQISSNICSLSTDYCCVPNPPSSSILWIIILSVLIILTALAIIFRKKLKMWWIKFKSKFKKGGSANALQPRPRGPPPFPPRPTMNFQRRPQQFPPLRSPVPKSSPEVNDVLKKLKEIGK